MAHAHAPSAQGDAEVGGRKIRKRELKDVSLAEFGHPLTLFFRGWPPNPEKNTNTLVSFFYMAVSETFTK